MTGFALHVRAACAVLVLAASALLATPAHAVDVQPGDDCSAKFVSGVYRPTGGPENPDGALLVCDGNVWQPILRYSSVGNRISVGGGDLPAAPLHVWGEAIIGSNGLACTGSAAGAMRYSSASDLWEYCNGNDWVPFGGDNLGDHTATQSLNMAGHDITDIGNVGIGTDDPQAALDVAGAIQASDRIKIRGTVGLDPPLMP